MNFIIVDDESAAHSNIEEFANEISYLKKVANCYHAFEALTVLKDKRVDLIFLDINMPKLSGFEMLKSLSNPPKIIVTSAYQEFALEGFELNVVDYLLKPFSFDRFLKAINKLETVMDSSTHPSPTEHVEDFIFVKSDKKYHKIALSNILFVEAQGNYIRIITKNEKLLTYMSMTEMERNISENLFIRVHKSYIVAIRNIDSVEGNRIKMDSYEIPIGQNYKKYVFHRLGLQK
ncbi:LytR/AlgR family response regulator transcription factor [Portibacter marinus]|uniref:LytR/AlgR family response regulator transcription factor n=1 Tax=Portibacter marinus TaxID=2898660 RepID=UPI001F265614|nr:LytTR family DNA-binding domain-containing protein [Portibacter marinus]